MEKEPINLSTLGVRVAYAVETTAGTRPTSGYTYIPSITSTPEMNPTPENIDVTDLAQTEFKQSVPGLKDLGGAVGFGANLTGELITVWDTICSAADTAKAAGKRVWFVIIHPELTKCVAFTGIPSKMGLPSVEVNSALQTTLNITPTNAPEWVAKPTVGTTNSGS